MKHFDNIGTQTQTIAFFKVKRSEIQNLKDSRIERASKTRVKRQSTKISIEDFILDSILKDRIIFGSNSITNTWLADIFTKTPEPFSVSNDCSLKMADNDWQLFKNFVIENGHEEFLLKLESTFKDVLLHRAAYFNKFNKYIRSINRNIYEGVTIFVIWLSRYFKHKITLFIFYVLSILLYIIYRSNPSDTGILRYFIDRFVTKKDFSDVNEVENLFYTIFGERKISYIEFKTIVQYLVDYFSANGLLNDA